MTRLQQVNSGGDPEATGRPKRVTIKDIAREASVARSTVSFALNNRAGVGEPTRQRILSVASAMGWRPNSAARALRAAQAKTIGMVLERRPSPFQEEQSAFLLNLITGIDNELSFNGFVLLLHTVPDLQAEIVAYEQWAVERRVDGVVVYSPRVRDLRLPALERLGLRAVVLGDIPGSSSLASVWTDNCQGAALAVNHLIAIGHRRIARIGVNPMLRYAVERRCGFERAMAAAGLPGDLSVNADFGAARCTLELLRRPDRPTAIIFEADTLAIEGILALQNSGVRIPEEISVVAWDDCTMYRLFSPPLTALHRDIPAMGRTVARTLIRYLETGTPDKVEGATTQLILRRSTAPLPPSCLEDSPRCTRRTEGS